MRAGFRGKTRRHFVSVIISGMVAIGFGLSASWAQMDDREVETIEDTPVQLSAQAQHVIDYWTAERMAAAEPEPFYIESEADATDDGPQIEMQTQSEPSVTISNMSPKGWDPLDPSRTFEFEIAGDTDSIASVWVDMRRTYADNQIDKRVKRGGLKRAHPLGNGKWALTLSEPLTELRWSWQVVVRHQDRSETRSNHKRFRVLIPDDRSRPVPYTNQYWSKPFLVDDTFLSAIGRLYFEKLVDPTRNIWKKRICTGTVVNDNASDRSLILTAAHCIYNTDNNSFTRNVLFIPDLRHTDGEGTDGDCANDPYGCWVPQFGVIDSRYASYAALDDTQKKNTPKHLKYSNSASRVWDFGFYVVPDTNAHIGGDPDKEALDGTVSTYEISFDTPRYDDGVSDVAWTRIFAYEQRHDPALHYCSNAITTEFLWRSYGRAKSLCSLQGGASGGPWIYNFDKYSGSGKIVSVSSVAVQNGYGVWGPKFAEASAECVFDLAREARFNSVLQQEGAAGLMLQGDCRNRWGSAR